MEDCEFLAEDIDLGQLEIEWQRHPARYNRIATTLAEEQSKLARLESQREAIEAEIDSDVRQRPEHYGFAKTTEAAIAGAVAMHDKVIEAKKSVLRCRADIEMLKAAINTMEHRKRALENLVTLHGQNYFSVPRTKSDNEAFRERSARVTDRSASDALNRNRKK
jgi:hypothetical protein